MDKHLHCWVTSTKSCNNCEDVCFRLSMSAVKSTVIMAIIIEIKKSEYCYLLSYIELTLIEVLVCR